jgi:predicted amidophosphoribosyltransferase
MAFAPIAGRGWFLSPHLFACFLHAPFIALAESNHLIVPTPLHAKRYPCRRFNQSAELVRLSCHQNKTGIFALDALVRPKVGSTQARLRRSQ